MRGARIEDTKKIAELYKNSFPEHIMVQRRILSNPDYILQRINNNDESWVVSEQDETIIGVAALAMAPPVGLGEIERVCVDTNHRGKNIAYNMCEWLVNEAIVRDLGFIEAFARGDQPSMQRTFEKLGFRVYGVAPRFEVVHDQKIVREQFVHMGLEIKPDTIDEKTMILIPAANELYKHINILR